MSRPKMLRSPLALQPLGAVVTVFFFVLGIVANV